MNNSTFLLVGFIVFLISGSIAVFYLPEVFSEEEFNVTESHCNLSDNICIEENLFTPISNATETGYSLARALTSTSILFASDSFITFGENSTKLFEFQQPDKPYFIIRQYELSDPWDYDSKELHHSLAIKDSRLQNVTSWDIVFDEDGYGFTIQDYSWICSTAWEIFECYNESPKYVVDLLDVYEILPTESDPISLTDSITKPTPIRRNLVEEYWNLCDTFFFNECYIVGAY